LISVPPSVLWWERRLASEGLAPLDMDSGDGCIAVSARGNGIPHTPDARPDRARERHRFCGTWEQVATAWTAREQYGQLQRDVMRTHRFRRPADRRVWKLHAAGKSLRAIARAERTTLWDVRQSIKRTLEAWRALRERPSEAAIDPEVGAALSEAMRGCDGDLDAAYERALGIPELAEYLEAL
jgi:hypothetical protein